MEIGLIISLIFVIICPFAHAFVNIFDKYIVSYRVKKPLGIAALSFIPLIIFGLTFIIFSDWSKINPPDILAPIFAGLFAGLQYYSYFFLIKREDASNLSGVVYLYPVLVALLSFFILHERLGLVSYFGLLMIILGVIMLSKKTVSSKSLTGFLILFVNILLIACYEFSAKLTTSSLSIVQGLGIVLLTSGIVVGFGIFFKRVREDFIFEFKNLKWIFATESFTLIAALTLFIALSNIPVTLVSAIASVQPLIVLFYERIAEKRLKRISHHDGLRSKLIPIIFIIFGILIMYLKEMLK